MTSIIKKFKDATFNKENSSNFQIESKAIYGNDSNLNNITNLDCNQEIKLIPAQNNKNFFYSLLFNKTIYFNIIPLSR